MCLRVWWPSTSFSSSVLKNFTSNNKLQIVRNCHVLGSVQREEISKKSRSIGDWYKDSTIGRYFGKDQVGVRFLILVIS